MASSILGKSIDIHGGGIDLIFPHHENEVAQSEGAYKQNYVKYWMHWNFINFGAHKMSKSLGNIKTGRSFIEQYNPEILKYMILRAHYRSLVDFSEEQIQDAIHGLARFYSAMCAANSIVNQKVEAAEVMPEFKALIEKTLSDISSALNDDFNTPKMFASLFEVVRFFNGKYKRGQKITAHIVYMAEEFLKLMRSRGKLLSLFQHDPESFLKSLDNMLLSKKNIKREEVDALIAKRIEARSKKDFKTSDDLRNQLVAMGISIQDTPQGTYWEVTK
jgi:cysteinyl-tRNA synthetase